MMLFTFILLVLVVLATSYRRPTAMEVNNPDEIDRLFESSY